MSKSIEIPSAEELMKISKEVNDKKEAKSSIKPPVDDFVKISEEKSDTDECNFCHCKGCAGCVGDEDYEIDHCVCCPCEDGCENGCENGYDEDEFIPKKTVDPKDLKIPSREELDKRFHDIHDIKFDDNKYNKYKKTCIDLINKLSNAGCDRFAYYDCNPTPGKGSVYVMKLIDELRAQNIKVITEFSNNKSVFYIGWGPHYKKDK